VSRRLASFGQFWWDFVVGDDWRTSVYVVVAIGATAAIAAGGITAWWVMPLVVLFVLYTSLRRATRAQ
jgi:hypothetical protein